MKGNEARVIFYLHPVDELENIPVLEKSNSSTWWKRLSLFFFLLILLLTATALVFVLTHMSDGQSSIDEPSTTLSTGTTGATTEGGLPLETTKGTATFPQPNLESNNATLTVTSTTTTPLTTTSDAPSVVSLQPSLNITNLFMYATIASATLLTVYIISLFLAWSDIAGEFKRAWRAVRGQAPDQKMLLHTQPYYLAVTRASCEVRMTSVN